METADLIVQFYGAYNRRDRAAFAAMMADDFTFTSPYDDHISKAAYFERCWTPGDQFKTFTIKQALGESDHAFVLYEVETKAGAVFRNSEFFTQRDGKVISVEVFFGQK